ncbi:ABC transporter ATP-binding protein [Tumebacillus avium]|uniref:ABC transporter ATP-binding protein n=1 Tax=Tumebacillus avium TaxID=1903704 RepID=A0A1Y0IJF6_9BACL|nr:ABC transporter ATP-binding protein [Tumebacillus avium]ARU60209.1 ABC transporter ATP-binding protein [Tumebacillus avium]
MIEVKGLRFSYPGQEEETLKGLSFAIGRGEIFGFLGPSGAGKSTTQKILIGILKGYQGDVRALGQELRTVRGDFFEKIGVAFEFPNFYGKFTVLENLQFFASLYKGETEDPLVLLERVGLLESAQVRVADFSKGMKMRLNFVRAFLHRPQLIFLDEPTSGLDPVNSKIIKDFMMEQKAAGKTIVLNTHNMNAAAELCDRVAFLVDGGIKLIDSPRELMIGRSRKVVRLEYREEGTIHASEFALADVGVNREFLRLLQEKDVLTLHTQEASLEDIFLEVTGKRLA